MLYGKNEFSINSFVPTITQIRRGCAGVKARRRRRGKASKPWHH